ncbi:serpin family protein [Pedosphaera parvula]|nr:serpin family protein [Pedosphaera parvula]
MYKNLTLLGILTGVMFASVPVKSETTNAIPELVQENNAFALELYGKLKSKEGNLFFSPYSVSTCLGMAYAGARGETEKQMAKTLHFSTNQAALHTGFGELQKELNKKPGVTLKVANALLAQKGMPFSKEFLDCLNKTYQADAMRFDFGTQAQLASDELNGWVAKKTEGRIQTILQPEALDRAVALVLVNAVYFKGAWATPFSKEVTMPNPFYFGKKGSVTAQMMYQQEHFDYYENPKLKALKLPYAGRKLSMVILLPSARDGLPDLESFITTQSLSSWISQMHDQEVAIQLPKFKMDEEFDLNSTLGEMGLHDAFCSKADFRGMMSSGELHLSKVLHKSFVEVNETETEAAAVTMAGVAFGNTGKPGPKGFFADHPFLFVIRDNGTGSILFMGRVMDPMK